MDAYRLLLGQAYSQALLLAERNDCPILRDQANMIYTMVKRIADKADKAYFWLGDDA
jgi:hypothetical protein